MVIPFHGDFITPTEVSKLAIVSRDGLSGFATILVDMSGLGSFIPTPITLNEKLLISVSDGLEGFKTGAVKLRRERKALPE
jgi:hypothetical protein